MVSNTKHICWFSEVGKDDSVVVGRKAADIGEMVQAKFPIPNGFIITADAYFQFLKQNNLTTKIKHTLATVDYTRPESLLYASSQVKKLITHGHMDESLARDIFATYRQLGGIMKDAVVAIHTSTTPEEFPGASYAGQQETFLHIAGDANVAMKVKEAWASLFEARAILSRHEKDFNHFRVGVAIIVQKMVTPEKSGNMFTADPVTNDGTKIVIEAIFGLSEYIMQGQITPDHYEVAKNDLLIIQKTTTTQKSMLSRVGKTNKEVGIDEKTGGKQKLTNHEILTLAELGKKVEKYYYFPQDIAWAIEGGRIYIIQTRPITTIDATKHAQKTSLIDTSSLEKIATGASASPGIVTGIIKVILSPHDISKILPGEIMVAHFTNPDYVLAMKKARAVLTEQGGRTSHAAIVSRELGIPAIVGMEGITKQVKTGQVVTVNGSKGEVFKGNVRAKKKDYLSYISHSGGLKTATKVYANLDKPEHVEKVAEENVDGIGLLRAESMIAEIGTHPKKIIHDGKQEDFIRKLAEQIEVFARAFSPRPVVYRASDFKTNAYRALKGGSLYEPIEANPLLGYRGALRYRHDEAVFRLELEAIKMLRHKANRKNIWLMLPFVRTVRELVEVKKIIAAVGLHRSPTFKLWMMVETPSNVVSLDDFIQIGIDGISIGSNDLTMLLLGTDRDNEEVAREYDELNPAVLWAFEHSIKTANKHRITSSICGQAPSLYPSLVEKLVQWGITSVSVDPSIIDSIRSTIATTERKILIKR